MSTLLTRRLANSELILRQLRHLAGHLPCDLCELKGGSNIETDGGCRHRGSIEVDTFDLHVIQKVERFIKQHHPNLSACIECGPVTCVDHSCGHCNNCKEYLNEVGTKLAEASPSSHAINT